jgi:hypothetical protein
MKTMHYVFAAWVLTLAASLGLVKAADDDAKPPKPAEPVKPDNTKINERDRPADRVTADQQSQAKGDVDLTARIRRAVVGDKALSTSAHNVKIITQNGSVILRGPVKTEQEKASVEQKAKALAGNDNVKNELEIAP